ncbi:serine hydrolase domain-containing protein [Pseudomonas chlororaphis]|uniref:serine hydrolase domain-containing protein n=1 Tax=Pseudomonas chlororaphis TaxID=587753 RepID=UPI0021F3F5AE|nr:serine hydrolase domain-containing protein [Pseudomonas chlororaphis]
MDLPNKGLVALAATLGASLASAATPDEELGRRMDTAIERAIDQQRIVGTVVVVMRDGQVVYQRAAGFADREAARPMTGDTILRLASITKSMVSAVAMRLVEQGKLSLDDTVSQWLPDFRPRLADGTQPSITLKQLLTHTAGLSYGFLEAEHGAYRTAGVSDGLAEPGMSLEDNLKRIASVPLSYPPGTQWCYSWPSTCSAPCWKKPAVKPAGPDRRTGDRAAGHERHRVLGQGPCPPWRRLPR